MSQPADEAKARLWIKIRLPNGHELGPGKIALLKAIATERSISGAARAMGMSYRRAWLLVDDVNSAFREPAIETFSGGHSRGGAALTAFGETLVALFDDISTEAERGAAGTLARLARLDRADAD